MLDFSFFIGSKTVDFQRILELKGYGLLESESYTGYLTIGRTFPTIQSNKKIEIAFIGIENCKEYSTGISFLYNSNKNDLSLGKIEKTIVYSNFSDTTDYISSSELENKLIELIKQTIITERESIFIPSKEYESISLPAKVRTFERLPFAYKKLFREKIKSNSLFLFEYKKLIHPLEWNETHTDNYSVDMSGSL